MSEILRQLGGWVWDCGSMRLRVIFYARSSLGCLFLLESWQRRPRLLRAGLFLRGFVFRVGCCIQTAPIESDAFAVRVRMLCAPYLFSLLHVALSLTHPHRFLQPSLARFMLHIHTLPTSPTTQTQPWSISEPWPAGPSSDEYEHVRHSVHCMTAFLANRLDEAAISCARAYAAVGLEQDKAGLEMVLEKFEESIVERERRYQAEATGAATRATAQGAQYQQQQQVQHHRQAPPPPPPQYRGAAP